MLSCALGDPDCGGLFWLGVAMWGAVCAPLFLAVLIEALRHR